MHPVYSAIDDDSFERIRSCPHTLRSVSSAMGTLKRDVNPGVDLRPERELVSAQ